MIFGDFVNISSIYSDIIYFRSVCLIGNLYIAVTGLLTNKNVFSFLLIIIFFRMVIKIIVMRICCT